MMYNEASLDNLIIKLMAHQFYKTQYTTTSNIATTQDILAVIVIPVNLEWSHIPHSNTPLAVSVMCTSLHNVRSQLFCTSLHNVSLH